MRNRTSIVHWGHFEEITKCSPPSRKKTKNMIVYFPRIVKGPDFLRRQIVHFKVRGSFAMFTLVSGEVTILRFLIKIIYCISFASTPSYFVSYRLNMSAKGFFLYEIRPRTRNFAWKHYLFN